MPALIVSSRYTTDSQILRQTADARGWTTLRLDGQRLPDWFECPDSRVALFYTAPHAFEIAAQLGRKLLGCDPGWVLRLPLKFVRRSIRQMSLAQALGLGGKSFVKHAVSKAFPAHVYGAAALAEATSRISREALVHVAEPIEWSVEYRCFVRENEVVAISPYRRHDAIFDERANLLGAPEAEIESARRFAASVVEHAEVDCPPAFVLDVGVIHNDDWAVVEVNECWASGIYACEPANVLETLVRACVPTEGMNANDERWDFQRFYSIAG